MLTSRYRIALNYAFDVHRNDARVTGVPTLGHLLVVAGTVIDNGGTEDEAIAALLHDAAEDQGGRERLDDISAKFGTAVASIVEGCSDRLGDPKPPWLERKQAFLAALPTKSTSVFRVLVADKLHNSRAMFREAKTMGPELWLKIGRSAEATIAYYLVTHEILRFHHPGTVTEELGSMVARLESSYCDPGELWTWASRLRPPGRQVG